MSANTSTPRSAGAYINPTSRSSIAAGTNPVDAKLRAAGGSAGLEAPMILGADISGVVEEVGPGVTAFAPSDEVYYTPEVFGPRSHGSCAEYHAAKADAC